LLESLFYIFEQQQGWIISIELQKFAQISMLSGFAPNSFFLKDSEEIFCLKEHHCELPGFCLDNLFKDDFFKELLGRHVVLNQVQHQHNHNLD